MFSDLGLKSIWGDNTKTTTSSTKSFYDSENKNATKPALSSNEGTASM